MFLKAFKSHTVNQRVTNLIWMGIIIITVIFYLSKIVNQLFDAGDVSPSSLEGQRRRFAGRGVVELPKDSLPWWDGGECECRSANSKYNQSSVPLADLNGIGGSCGRRAWAAGYGQRVLSYSLFGINDEYWKGFSEILTKVAELYPGYFVRVYTDPRGRHEVICPLLKAHPQLHVCDVTNLPLPLGNISSINPRVWRYAALGDTQVSLVLFRDGDSQILEREVAAVNEWVPSQFNFHVMRDVQFESMPIMAGMWGAKWGKIEELNSQQLSDLRNQLITSAENDMSRGFDQETLRRFAWPMMRKNVMQHDSHFCTRFPDNSRPFPTQRPNRSTFVGSTWYRNRKQDLVKKCPLECRPVAHQDWEYC